MANNRWTRVRNALLVAFAAALAMALLGWALVTLWPRASRPAAPAGRLVNAEAAEDVTGFARAAPGRALVFPADHGPHPDFQTEWWYYTGNLATADGRRFGYQLTFFRRALQPPPARAERASDWAAEQVYLAHFALTDVQAGRHQAFERLERGAAGLAGAQADPFAVWLNDWQVVATGPQTYRLEASGVQEGEPPLVLQLSLEDQKGPILQGDQGYSQKGPDPGQASYYYSLTRLRSAGTIQVGAQTFTVDGWSWMDHEFSTSVLSPDQAGWDWFSIQLDDGRELMVFQIRRADGSLDPFSSGTWIDAGGETQRLSRADFEIEPTGAWTSPRSGAEYPAGWVMSLPALDLRLELRPYVADQEMNVSYIYWEGAVQVSGSIGGAPVQGSGYVEMTGYAGSMGGEF